MSIVPTQDGNVPVMSIVPVQERDAAGLRKQQRGSLGRNRDKEDVNANRVKSSALRDQVDAYAKRSADLAMMLQDWLHYISFERTAVVCKHPILQLIAAAQTLKRTYDALLAARDYYWSPLNHDLHKHLPVTDESSKHPVDVLALLYEAICRLTVVMLDHRTASPLTWYRITGVTVANPHWVEIALDYERSPRVIASAVMNGDASPFKMVDLILQACETRERTDPDVKLPLPAYEETVCACCGDLPAHSSSSSESK